MTAVQNVIDARVRDIGGFRVRRVLPAGARRLVGPFIYLDHMGPVELAPGSGLDVPPHPHIGLETVTYLFDGELEHRDSVGSHQLIAPGAINWMTAGRGVVHSERTATAARTRAVRLHGLQIWVALPRDQEQVEPAFSHYPASALPELERGGARVRVLAGSAYEASSPVKTASALFYLDVALAAGASLTLPAEYEERAVYVVRGEVSCGPERAAEARMLVLAPGADVTLGAEGPAHVVVFGGAPIDGPRHIWWNFVSSSREHIERAKQDWKAGRFPKVPGDDAEPVPLPE